MCARKRSRGWSEHRAVSALLLTGIAVLALVSPAGANPLPDTVVLIHVRAAEPPGQEGCTIPGIVSCQDIVNSTTLTGEVEFDIFVERGISYVPNTLQTTLTWPASWSFIRWEPCNGANAWLNPGVGTGQLEALWPDCPLVEGIHLVGRLVMDVTGYGQLQPSSDGVLYVNCPPDEPVGYYAPGVYAEAGVTCDYTMMECWSLDRCIPVLSQAEVAFSSGPGGVLAADIPFQIESMGGPCNYYAEAETAWLSVSHQQVGYDQYVLHLVANPVGLGPGVYTTHAMLTAAPPLAPVFRRCVSVTLEIPQNSAVPEDPGLAREIPMSWSQVKSVYR